MFDTICTYPLTSDLFAQCVHPSSPLLAFGLASGHVQIQRLPPADANAASAPEAGHSTIETVWRTRRHKGSCRSLCFSHDGEILFSAGTDGLVKAAKTETGKVESKIGVPLHKYNPVQPPPSILPLTFTDVMSVQSAQKPIQHRSSTPSHHKPSS